MAALPADRSLAALTRKTLVAPRLKVLYTPTTKVASTTIKWMLARAEGSLDESVIPRLMAAITNRSQTIHNRHVSGLAKLSEYPADEAKAMLDSPEWLHIAALRDPVARAYSAWENRIFMRASGRVAGGFDLTPDVLLDGRIDMTATFARFAVALAEHTDAFMGDHHFTPQSHLVRKDAVRYDLLVRVDEAGGIDRIVSALRERGGGDVVATRHNESMGIALDAVCDQHTANRLMATYAADYEAFGFARREFAANLAPYMLTDAETQLVTLVRQSVERVGSVSRAAQSKMSARYGLRQIRKSLLRKVSFGRMYSTPRSMHW
jgi:hypothetical protein